MTISKIRVYLLDDHDVVRAGVRLHLEAAGDIEVVGESGSAVEATRQIPAMRPDVAILDGRLPDGSGVAVCREVRSSDPHIRGLILTSYDDDQALFAAILAGASGYVLKELNGTKLVHGVRLVAAGTHLIDPHLIARVLDRVSQPTTGVPDPTDLTSQEVALLTLITHGMTDSLIAAELSLDVQGVRRLVASIMSKVGLERGQAPARASGPSTGWT